MNLFGKNKYPLEFLNILIISSQNLANYDLNLPENTIFRINMAWCDSIEQFENILNKHKNNYFFIHLFIHH